MEKDKLVLHDGTEIILEESKGIEKLYVGVTSKTAVIPLWELLTPDNLKEIQIVVPDGTVTGIYKNRLLSSITCVENSEETIIVEITLREKTEIELLREEIEQLKAGQQTQDAAIDDLGQTVSDIAVGGAE